MKSNLLLLATLAAAGVLISLAAGADDQPPAADKPKSDVAAALDRASISLAPAYTLAYKFAAGDEIRTKVVHLVTVETTIKGVNQTASTRSVSTKLWKIARIEPTGNIVFEHSVEDVNMWQNVTGRQEVRYNSTTDRAPPPGHEHIAASLGKVLSVITMDKCGRILARDDKQKQFNPGIGDLTIPFPAEPVKAGGTWSIPNEVRVSLDDGTVKKVATRQRYKLDKVEAGVATINVETQMLTPVNDPKVQSQLVQRLQKGTIKFDIDAGRLIHKQMDLDESVYGFSGPDSHMQYLARFTEEPATADAATATAKTEKPGESTK
ncbi:MAG: DUF6263 family protein [Planctomycetes bacterium]|nr:DUF6263 family protein [Planctomycetota bacterium]